MEFDDILLDVGDYHKYQLLILYVFILPICAFAGIQSFIQLFLSASPKEYWCRIPGLQKYDALTRVAAGIPRVKGALSNDTFDSFSHCLMYQTKSTLRNGNRSLFSPDPESSVVPCQNGWEYGLHEPDSVVTTWDLVCGREGYTTLALLCFTLGSVCGLILFGALSDILGRKLSIFLCVGIQAVFGTAAAFAPNFPFWCACRFFVGLSIPSSLRISMIYAIELVRPEKRTRVSVLSTGCYTLGTILLAGLAWAIPHWRKLSLFCTVPELIFLGAWFWIPESPRWLLAKNRALEIKEFLRYAAQINGRVVGSNTINKLDLIMDHENIKGPATATFFDLFRLPNLRKKTILITLIWFCNISVYMGLSYYSPTLGGSSIYLSYLLSMVIEVPAYTIVWYLTEKLGRRMPLCVAMICAGVLCVVTVALPADNPDAVLAMYLLGKFFITGSFFVICVYAGELYPTVVRGVGLGTSATIATLGVCLGPVIIHLGKDYMTLPLVVFGIFAILGGFAPLFLPETWHQKLPETLAEGEDFGTEPLFTDLFKLRPGTPYQEGYNQPAVPTTKKAGPLVVSTDTGADKDEDELAFERKAHLRTFPQPSGKKPASRLNSSTYLMTKQDNV